MPEPTGPQAPPELEALVTKALNLGWFSVLTVSLAMAMWGLASMAYASKHQQFGGVNQGQKTLVWALIGGAGMTVLRGVFSFFGV
jgi:hypothetical protein